MPKPKRGKKLKEWKSNRAAAEQGKLRIVGGRFRGRQIAYSGDPVTRPMKDHTREALFNLVGGWVPGKACFDLFAGTGAIGIEAISRGATVAYLIERHFPTLGIIKENVRSLDADMNVHIEGSDTFFWARQFLNQPDTWPTDPWIVFCCPPYALFDEHAQEMDQLIASMVDAAPDDSLIIVEAGENFSTQRLPHSERWESRKYPPARVAVFKKW